MEFRVEAARSEVVKEYLRLARLHKHSIGKEGPGKQHSKPESKLHGELHRIGVAL